MAMNKGDAECTTGLSKEMYDKLKAMVESKTGWAELEESEKTSILECLKDRAWIYSETIVDHIKNNADVTGVATDVAVTSVSGVTAGEAASGPGTGTGTQTGAGSVE